MSNNLLSSFSNVYADDEFLGDLTQPQMEEDRDFQATLGAGSNPEPDTEETRKKKRLLRHAHITSLAHGLPENTLDRYVPMDAEERQLAILALLIANNKINMEAINEQVILADSSFHQILTCRIAAIILTPTFHSYHAKVADQIYEYAKTHADLFSIPPDVVSSRALSLRLQSLIRKLFSRVKGNIKDTIVAATNANQSVGTILVQFKEKWEIEVTMSHYARVSALRRGICAWDHKLDKKKAIKKQRLGNDNNDSASTSSGSQSGTSAPSSEPVYGEKDIWSYIDDLFAAQREECLKNSDGTREDFLRCMRNFDMNILKAEIKRYPGGPRDFTSGNGSAVLHDLMDQVEVVKKSTLAILPAPLKPLPDWQQTIQDSWSNY